MDATATAPVLRFFRDLKDPRRHNLRHLFTDPLTLAILAIICRADDWDEVVVRARARADWLQTFLSLPNGIPCADIFRGLTDEVKRLGEELLGQRKELSSVAVVESTRNVAGEVSSIRAHWGVENRLHWQLDMTFNEDLSRARKDHGVENLSSPYRLALNLPKKTPGKGRLKNKRFRCSLDPDYPMTVPSQQDYLRLPCRS